MLEYAFGCESGMGGAVVGAVYDNKCLIGDCVNNCLIIAERNICVFQLHLPHWTINGIHSRVVCYDGNASKVWICHNVDVYGSLSGHEEDTVVFRQIVGGSATIRIDMNAGRGRAREIALVGGMACPACREEIGKFGCSQCMGHRYDNTGMWRRLLEELD